MSATNTRFELLTLERLQEIYDLISVYPPGVAVWGSITGTLSSQTDLQSALNAKQDSLILTTTGTSGPATLIGSTLNIPQYSGGGGGGVTSVTATSPMTSSGGTTPNLAMPSSNSTTDGYLLASDWIIFNGKFNTPTGTTSQYVRGDGSLATFPTIPTVTPSALTKTDDTNVTLTLGGSPSNALLQAVSLTLGWTGTLADSRIASASTWNAKQNAITLTTTGTTGAATLVGSTLNIPQYSNAGTTVFIGNANGAGVANGALGTIYLGGAPVTMLVPTTQYGSAANQFFPGYPMPSGVGSKLSVITRSAQPATNVTYVYLSNYDASLRGAQVTIAAGSAAGTFTDDSTTVTYTTNQRLFVIVQNPNVVGGATSAQITTISFKYTLS